MVNQLLNITYSSMNSYFTPPWEWQNKGPPYHSVLVADIDLATVVSFFLLLLLFLATGRSVREPSAL